MNSLLLLVLQFLHAFGFPMAGHDVAPVGIGRPGQTHRGSSGPGLDETFAGPGEPDRSTDSNEISNGF